MTLRLTDDESQALKRRAEQESKLLFVRQHKSDEFGTSPYLFAGPARYVQHTGERPIAITWKLDHALPNHFFLAATVASLVR